MVESDQEHNLRQFRRMLERLRWYREGSLVLGPLVAELEALAGALRGPTRSWQEEFWPTWGVLEDVLAVMLNEGRAKPNRLDRELIGKSVDRLTSLVESGVAAG